MAALKGKVSLVTGGASGLGKQLCLSLAGAGSLVYIADINFSAVEDLLKALEGRGYLARGVRLDVSDKDLIEKAYKQIEDESGRLDILVNNAAVDFTKSLDEISADEWERVLRVNLFGPFLLSKYAFRMMGQGGQIVNITSTAAKRTWENASAYHASKWGLLGFSHAIHTEGRKRGIKVTAVVAGGMRTPFILERFPDTDPALLQDPAVVASLIKFILTLPKETVIPEVMVIPMKETSWP